MDGGGVMFYWERELRNAPLMCLFSMLEVLGWSCSFLAILLSSWPPSIRGC